MALLKTRLLDAEQSKQRKEQADTRKSLVGTGDRSERIRTYNFPQDRVTDHRIRQSWSNIPGILDGKMDKIITALEEGKMGEDGEE